MANKYPCHDYLNYAGDWKELATEGLVFIVVLEEHNKNNELRDKDHNIEVEIKRVVINERERHQTPLEQKLDQQEQHAVA